MRSLKAAAIVAFLALTSGSSYATKQVLSEAYRSIDHLVEKADTGAFRSQVQFRFNREALEAYLTEDAKSSGETNRDVQIGALLKKIANAADLKGPERVFRPAGKHEEKHIKYGLDLWYRAAVRSVEQTHSSTELSESHASVKSINKLLDSDHVGLLELVEPRARVKLHYTEYETDDPYLSTQDHYETINLYEAWSVTGGDSDVVVQVCDTGTDPDHEDLLINIWNNTGETSCSDGVDNDGNGYIDDCHGYDFGDDSSTITASGDHGIHIQGTVAADSDNGVGVAGVAGGTGGDAGASVMVGQVFGRSTDDGFDEALIYGTDNGAHITSNSWGYTSSGVYESSVLTAIDYATDAGVLVVFAAGNDDDDSDWYPGYYKKAIAVAAVDDDGERASFSNYGSWINISAPGVSVYSTYDDSDYGYMSGTSMACPHVSGILALGLARAQMLGMDIDEDSTKQTVLDCLYSSATDIDDLNSGYEAQLGNGLADVPAMFDCLAGPSPAPTVTPAPSVSKPPTLEPTNQPTPQPTAICTCDVTAELIVKTDAYPSETSYTLYDSASNCAGSIDIAGDYPYSSDLTTTTTTLSTSLCVGEQYTFAMIDSYGDGLCCSYGSGYWQLNINDVLVASGDSFTYTDSYTFIPSSTDDDSTPGPTLEPSVGSSQSPTAQPIPQPTSEPTPQPTPQPTRTREPTNQPTTLAPTTTPGPTPMPTHRPTTQCICNITAKLIVRTDDNPNETSYSLSDSSTTNCAVTVDIDGDYPYVDANQQYTTTLANNLCVGEPYDFAMIDSAGDGLCCSSGSGYWKLEVEGTVVAEGDQFENTDSFSFVANYTMTGIDDDDSPGMGRSVSTWLLTVPLAATLLATLRFPFPI